MTQTMTQTIRRRTALGEPKILLAVAGPLLLGTLPGLRFGLGPTLRLGPSLLLALLATVVTMGPALYLQWGLTGARGTFKEVGGAFVDALTAAGQVHLGFAPVVLLLSATVAYGDHALFFALGAFVAGLGVGGARLWRALRTGASASHAAMVLVPWSAAAVLMGGRLGLQLLDVVLRKGG